MSSPTTTLPSHRLECSPEEVASAACLNGGTCFVLDTGGNRVPGCSCTSDWTGNRCQLMNIDPELYGAQVPILGVSLGLAVAGVFIIAIVALIIVFCVRRKRRRNRPSLSSSNCASVHVVDGGPSNGQVHKSKLEMSNISQQTTSSYVTPLQDLNGNKSSSSNMTFETQV